jgi:hypothetical protein
VGRSRSQLHAAFGAGFRFCFVVFKLIILHHLDAQTR